MQGCFCPTGPPVPRSPNCYQASTSRTAMRGSNIDYGKPKPIIEAIDDQIHVSVKIEVSHAKTIGNPLIVKPHCSPTEVKFRSPITKGDISHQRRIANLFFSGIHPVPLAPLHDIRIQRIHEVAIDHQQVLPTIQIHIEENRAPGPISGFQALCLAVSAKVPSPRLSKSVLRRSCIA